MGSESELDILYDHLEFFFTVDDLRSMLKINSASYKEWSKNISLKLSLKDKKPGKDKFCYNIIFTTEYKNIKGLLIDMKTIIEKPPGEIEDDAKKRIIREKIKEIQKQYNGLEYYDEIYVYAHHIFNSIRNDILKQTSLFSGGGMSLEEFKEIIRQKVKLLNQ